MNLRPKKLHHSQQMQRKATWLELFFDLSLVVPIYQLSHYLADNLTLFGILSYIVLFMAVLQTWQNHAYFNEQFELPEGAMRAFTVLKILLLICMTAFIPTALGEGKLGFVIFFCAIRLYMTCMWTWASRHHPELRKLTNTYTEGTLLGTILLILSLWLPGMWMLLFWLAAIVIDAILPSLILGVEGREHLSISDHLPERYGLFFLVLLGESIISITMFMVSYTEGFSRILFPSVLGLFLVFGIWWLYIDNILAKPVRRTSVRHRVYWHQGHLGLFLVLPALGASISLLLKSYYAPESIYILFVTLVLVFMLFFLGIIERGLKLEEHAPCQDTRGILWRGLSIGLLLFLMIVPWWPAWVIFLILNGIVWFQVFISRYCDVEKKLM